MSGCDGIVGSTVINCRTLWVLCLKTTLIIITTANKVQELLEGLVNGICLASLFVQNLNENI